MTSTDALSETLQANLLLLLLLASDSASASTRIPAVVDPFLVSPPLDMDVGHVQPNHDPMKLRQLRSCVVIQRCA